MHTQSAEMIVNTERTKELRSVVTDNDFMPVKWDTVPNLILRSETCMRLRHLVTLLDSYGDMLDYASVVPLERNLSLSAISDRIKQLLGHPLDSYDQSVYLSPSDVTTLPRFIDEACPINLLCPEYVGHMIQYDLQDYDRGFPWRRATNVLHYVAYKLRFQNGAEQRLARFVFPSWQLREAYRIAALGASVSLPWGKELAPIADHYAHLTDDGQVRYTPDAIKAERSVHVLIKPGRYLRKYYPSLTNEQVEAWQGSVNSAFSLHFARTSEEIVAIYEESKGTGEGPVGSCMGYRADHYESGHPCRVYGSGSDLTLVYLRDAQNQLAARTLVWEAKKRWVRMYGDHAKLKAKLEAKGYTQGSVSGAKIHRIKSEHGRDCYVMPYIDIHQTFGEYDDKWFTIEGEYEGANTTGVACMQETSCCDSCGDRFDYNEMVSGPDDDGVYCESCFDVRYLRCEHTGDVVRNEDITEVVVGYSSTGRCIWQSWCNDAVSDNAFNCDFTDRLHSNDAFEPVEMANGDTWSNHAFERHGYVASDGERYPLGEGPGISEAAE